MTLEVIHCYSVSGWSSGRDWAEGGWEAVQLLGSYGMKKKTLHQYLFKVVSGVLFLSFFLNNDRFSLYIFGQINHKYLLLYLFTFLKVSFGEWKFLCLCQMHSNY